ncbi:MAG: septum site-determining protein MinC [Francisellaceae bacterium]|nr:septum site-determining protein MinC [Francisellaceae bacterium]
MKMDNTLTKEQQAFKLKACSYNITTLILLDNNIKEIANQLSDKIKLAPNFFQNGPIVIDLSSLHESNKFIDFNELKKHLLALGLLPIGVKNANLHYRIHAENANLAVLGPSSTQTKKTILETTEQDNKNNSKLFLAPIRSGQQVVQTHGDLTICSSVGHGAEVVADGNIHIYGSLKGKAIAGMNGNKQARIFCSSLEAELISIAGLYMPSEEIEKILWKKAAMICIENDHISIETI